MATTIQQAGGNLQLGRYYRYTVYVKAPNSQICQFGWHFFVNSINPGVVTLGEVGQWLLDGISVNLQDCMSQDAIIYGAKVADVSVGPKPLPGQVLLGDPGTVAEGFQGTQVCGMIRTGTQFAGRGGRGRWYIPMVYQTAMDSTTGYPAASYVTKLGTLAASCKTNTETMLIGFDTVIAKMVVYHRGLTTGDTVISTNGGQKFGTQKRRGDYGKLNALPF